MGEPTFPPYPNVVEAAGWYCLHCGCLRTDEAGQRDHFRNNHKQEQDDVAVWNVDYCRGTQLLRMQLERITWEQETQDEFARELAKLHTTDDFIAECEIADAR